MTNDLISIIVPIYMIDSYVGICIESIIKQTYKNIDIILVDDGSKDRCSEICDLYAGKDNRITVIHKKNGGLVSARKAGIRVAKGKYVTYVDGDDWIETDYIESLHKEAVENGADIVCAGYTRDLFFKSFKIYNDTKQGFYSENSLKKLYDNMISCDDFFHPGSPFLSWSGTRENIDKNI